MRTQAPPADMAKLLPLLTAAAMIGVIGGVLLWLIAAHREVVVVQVDRTPPPAAGSASVSGESQPIGDPTMRSSEGQSIAAASMPAPRISPAVETSLKPLPSQPDLSPRGEPVGQFQTTTRIQPSATFGRAPGRLQINHGGSTLEDALSFALQATEPYLKEGFTLREDNWGGDLPVKTPKAILQQLFKGNDYWFWMGTAVDGAKIAVHIYDSRGQLAEAESWQKPHQAAARVVPKKTDTYYIIVEVEKSPAERTFWALVYGFR